MHHLHEAGILPLWQTLGCPLVLISNPCTFPTRDESKQELPHPSRQQLRCAAPSPRRRRGVECTAIPTLSSSIPALRSKAKGSRDQKVPSSILPVHSPTPRPSLLPTPRVWTRRRTSVLAERLRIRVEVAPRLCDNATRVETPLRIPSTESGRMSW